MRRGRQRAEWDTATAILTAIISANSKRPASYEELHPHRAELLEEQRNARRLQSRENRKVEASLGWAIMKGVFGGRSRNVHQPKNAQADPQSGP